MPPCRAKQPETKAAWEALSALHQLARDLCSQTDATKNCQRILAAASTSLRVAALIWIPLDPEEPVLCQGEMLLTAEQARELARLLAQSPGFQASTPWLCNRPARTHWGRRYPHIDRLLALAMTEQDPGGLFLALNKRDGTPFRAPDAALLLPFLALLELQGHWRQRYLVVEEELRATQNQLIQAEKVHACGKSAGGIGHDLNNSLCAILGYLQLALTDKNLDPAIAGYLELARTCTLDAAQTVRAHRV